MDHSFAEIVARMSVMTFQRAYRLQSNSSFIFILKAITSSSTLLTSLHTESTLPSKVLPKSFIFLLWLCSTSLSRALIECKSIEFTMVLSPYSSAISSTRPLPPKFVAVLTSSADRCWLNSWEEYWFIDKMLWVICFLWWRRVVGCSLRASFLFLALLSN